MTLDSGGRVGFRPALARCVGVSEDEFVGRHWGQAPLLSRPPGGFADLFGLDAVDDLLSTHGLRTPFVRVARDGKVLPAGACGPACGGAWNPAPETG